MTQEESKLMEEHRKRQELRNIMELIAGLWCSFAQIYHGIEYADAEHAFGGWSRRTCSCSLQRRWQRMGDFINRADAIKHIKAYRDEFKEDFGIDSEDGDDASHHFGYIAGLNRATRIIDDLPSAEPYTEEEILTMQELEQAQIQRAFELGREDAEPKWIPVTERLPEKK